MASVVIEDAVDIGLFTEILLILIYELQVEYGDFEFHVIIDGVDEIVMLCGLALFESLLFDLYGKFFLLGLAENGFEGLVDFLEGMVDIEQ